MLCSTGIAVDLHTSCTWHTNLKTAMTIRNARHKSCSCPCTHHSHAHNQYFALWSSPTCKHNPLLALQSLTTFHLFFYLQTQASLASWVPVEKTRRQEEGNSCRVVGWVRPSHKPAVETLGPCFGMPLVVTSWWRWHVGDREVRSRGVS